MFLILSRHLLVASGVAIVDVVVAVCGSFRLLPRHTVPMLMPFGFACLSCRIQSIVFKFCNLIWELSVVLLFADVL